MNPTLTPATPTVPTIPSAATPALRHAAAGPAALPVVFVDGRPNPALAVVGYEAVGPMDRRTATVLGPRPAGAPQLLVALPYRLVDGEVHWQVLLAGRIAGQETKALSGLARSGFTVVDAWSAQLDRDLSADERDAYTDASSLAEVLGALRLALPGLGTAEVPVWLQDERLALRPHDRVSPGALLSAVCERFALRCRTDLERTASGHRRVTRLLPDAVGRPIPLPWPRGGVGRVLAVAGQADADLARLQIATGSRPRLEDTFTLTPGWDATLQGQPDADYHPETSTDFSRYARVYRGWVLNEDAAFPGPVYDANAALQLPGNAAPPPLALTDCLTTDATGQRLPPVIEYSTDAGASWQRYAGAIELMPDRAGVIITEPQLASGWIDAGEVGDLRLRVTATLVGDRPIRAQRLRGNPFLGEPRQDAFALGEAYRFDRVAPGSLHAAAIASGALFAEQRDDRAALGRVLLTDGDHRDPPALPATPTHTADLFGAWPAWRVGDRVLDPLAEGVGIDATPVLLGGRPGRVMRVRVRFASSGKVPETRLWLA